MDERIWVTTSSQISFNVRAKYFMDNYFLRNYTFFVTGEPIIKDEIGNLKHFFSYLMKISSMMAWKCFLYFHNENREFWRSPWSEILEIYE